MSRLLVWFGLVLLACSSVTARYARVQCGPNEIYLPQGVAPNCDTVCHRIGKPCNLVYIWPPFGCYCLPDHARNDNNVCVPISKCTILGSCVDEAK